MRISGFILLTLLAVLCGCEGGDKDFRYPSVTTDYACLLTGAEGEAERLRLDNGNTYPIAITDEYREAHRELPTYRPDTVYRVISIYELGADSLAHLYSLAQTVSVVPTALREGETLHQEPVYLQSYWLAGGYLNMVIELKALNGQHSIGFVDTTPETMRGREVTFYHRVIEDVEAYRQKVYCSLPLAPFDGYLQQGDTLRLVINLYDEGVTELEFAM